MPEEIQEIQESKIVISANTAIDGSQSTSMEIHNMDEVQVLGLLTYYRDVHLMNMLGKPSIPG